MAYINGQKVELIAELSAGETPNIEALSVTQNGTYAASGSVDGYSPVTVNVPAAPAPSGTKNITDTALTDVTAYANAQVVDANLVAENIAKDVTILGITGTHEGGGGGSNTSRGTFTLVNDQYRNIPIPHYLGSKSVAVVYWPVSSAQDPFEIVTANRAFFGMAMSIEGALTEILPITLDISQYNADFPDPITIDRSFFSSDGKYVKGVNVHSSSPAANATAYTSIGETVGGQYSSNANTENIMYVCQSQHMLKGTYNFIAWRCD